MKLEAEAETNGWKQWEKGENLITQGTIMKYESYDDANIHNNYFITRSRF